MIQIMVMMTTCLIVKYSDIYSTIYWIATWSVEPYSQQFTCFILMILGKPKKIHNGFRTVLYKPIVSSV